MASQPPREQKPARDDPAVRENREQTQPAEERGERHATGKAIHRGGKSKGDVPGATPRK